MKPLYLSAFILILSFGSACNEPIHHPAVDVFQKSPSLEGEIQLGFRNFHLICEYRPQSDIVEMVITTRHPSSHWIEVDEVFYVGFRPHEQGRIDCENEIKRVTSKKNRFINLKKSFAIYGCTPDSEDIYSLNGFQIFYHRDPETMFIPINKTENWEGLSGFIECNRIKKEQEGYYE
tara:strand:- start:2939 stop:3469 length:531 start_codon:yes stop_codon:yes gene_type:complete